MSEVPGIERAVKNMRAEHDETDIHHAVAMLRVVHGEIAGFLKHCTDDPLLLAYDLRKPLSAWATELLKVKRWSDTMILNDNPEIPPTGAK